MDILDDLFDKLSGGNEEAKERIIDLYEELPLVNVVINRLQRGDDPHAIIGDLFGAIKAQQVICNDMMKRMAKLPIQYVIITDKENFDKLKDSIHLN